MNTASSSTPRFAAVLSREAHARAAAADVSTRALATLGGAPDLAVVFVSHHHGPDFAEVAADIRRQTGTRVLVGCTGESIVGEDREVEGAPALSLWLASLPGVRLVPMRLEFAATPEGGTIVGWSDELPQAWPPEAALIVLAEPFSFPADRLLERLNEDRPSARVVGGMASGAHQPGGNRILWGDREFDNGAVAVWIDGAVSLRSIVSQGCRPIGRHFVVTKVDRNVIYELSGRPALAQLQEVFQTLTPEEQQLAQQGLHVGSVTNEYRDSFGRGDFLVRNVIGADASSGAIAVGDFVRLGQTVQFQVRDADTADEDLRVLLAAVPEKPVEPNSRGALLFSCNGRGTRLFDVPHHDAGAIRARWSDIPLAGFFAQGEIGPVGGKNHVHGYTASIALFEPR